MQIGDLIGFIITMVIFWTLVIKQQQARKQQRAARGQEENPRYEEAPSEIQNILRSLGDTRFQEPTNKAPPPLPVVHLEEIDEDEKEVFEEEDVVVEMPVVSARVPKAFPKIHASFGLQAFNDRHKVAYHLEDKRKYSEGKVDIDREAIREAIKLKVLLGPPKAWQ